LLWHGFWSFSLAPFVISCYYQPYRTDRKRRQGAPALGYNPLPKTLPGFPKTYPVKGKTRMGGGKIRKRWKNDDGDILEWDYQHGKIERYDDKG
jgi:hypothetical protein